jgi:hypothetical protein
MRGWRDRRGGGAATIGERLPAPQSLGGVRPPNPPNEILRGGLSG